MSHPKRVAAYHEAGHILMALLCGWNAVGIMRQTEKWKEYDVLGEVRCEPQWNGLLLFFYHPFCFLFPFYRIHLQSVQIAFAGQVAEEILSPKDFVPKGLLADMENAALSWQFAYRHRPFWKRKIPDQSELFEKTRKILSLPENKKKLRRIARALIRTHRTDGILSGAEIKEIFQSR